jgi:transposase-like protein
MSVPGLPASRPKDQREAAFKLYAEGKTVQDIAFELAIPQATVRTWKNRDGWAARLKDPTLTPEAAVLATRRAQDIEIPETLPERQEKYQEQLGEAAIRFAAHVSTLEGAELVQQADRIKKADEVSRKALKLETEKPAPLINLAILCSKNRERQAAAAINLRNRRD